MPETMIEDRELAALLSLLESERDDSLAVLLRQLRLFPDGLLQRLAAMVPVSSPANEYINLVLAERDLTNMRGRLSAWLSAGAPLEEGVLLVARTGYPSVDPMVVRRGLDDLASDLRPHLPRTPSKEMLDVVAQRLSERHGFHQSSDHYSPDNSYLNRVLETRTGLPITLCILWILLGERLRLPISGVALPGHFIASISTPNGALYFDPFHAGALRSVRDIWDMVHASGTIFHPNHLRAATPPQIVRRMFGNLLHAYQVREDAPRIRLVRQYASVL